MPLKGFLFLLVCLCVLCTDTRAQDLSYDIVSHVVDAEDSPVFGNMVLLSPADSSIITGTYFLDGEAKITGVTWSPVLVMFTSLGYNDKIYKVSVDNNNVVDLGTVVLDNEGVELEEVVIASKKPLFEPTEEGGLTMNVQNTMLASSTTVLEVISKSPNVQVGDNAIRVIGKGQALIYLDGNPVTVQQLNTISVNQIEEVEVISNPSARYDANGQAVINIRTIGNISEGYSGFLTLNGTYAGYPEAFMGSWQSTVNYRKRKWSVSADYGNQLGTDYEKLDAIRTLSTEEGTFISDISYLYLNQITNSTNYRLGTSYDINRDHKVSFEFRGYRGVFDLDEQARNNISLANGRAASLATENTGRRESLTSSAILNYNAVLDTLGSTLFIGAQFSDFTSDRNEPILERYTLEGENQYLANRLSVGNSDIRIITSQVDYTKVFRNKNKLSLGAKFATADNEGGTQFSSKLAEEQEFRDVPGLSNEFTYEETVPAAYAQYRGISGTLKYSLGLRSEYTMAEGYSLALNQQVIDTSYVNLFPSASVTTNLSEIISVGLSYTSRIGRPHYRQLDPFVYYQDSLTSFQGNPYLKPELVQAFEFDINYQGFNFFKVGYNHAENSFRDLIEPGPTGSNSVVLRKVNVQQVNSWFARFNLPIDLSFWSSFNTVSMTFDKVRDDRPQFSIQDIKPQLYIYSYNEFTVSKYFNLELFGEYAGAKDDGIYYDKSTYSISAGVSRNFFNDKLTCRFVANDMFRTFRQAGSFDVGNATVQFDKRLSTNFYRLTLTYNFGKLKNISYTNKEIGKEERSRLRQAQ